MSKSIITAKQLTKSFHDGKNTIEILKTIDIEIFEGESIAIIGKSGSGKSTLLQILGGLDKPTSGQVIISNQDFYQLDETQRCKIRNTHLGFVYQFHHLLPEFTALENTAIPLILNDKSIKEATDRATDLLTKVGLEKRLEHRLAELSGGERQRVAIARALANQPAALLADEPTGNLDDHTSEEVFDLLLKLNQEFRTSLVIVTHDLNLARRTNRVMQLHEGYLQPLDQAAISGRS